MDTITMGDIKQEGRTVLAFTGLEELLFAMPNGEPESMGSLNSLLPFLVAETHKTYDWVGAGTLLPFSLGITKEFGWNTLYAGLVISVKPDDTNKAAISVILPQSGAYLQMMVREALAERSTVEWGQAVVIEDRGFYFLECSGPAFTGGWIHKGLFIGANI